MGDVSNKTIVALLAVALVVTVVGTVVSVSKLSTLGGQYSFITGAATSGTGTGSLTTDRIVGITMDDNTVDFGTGHVNVGQTQATVWSDGAADGEWTQTSGGGENNNMSIQNNGNTDVNLTMNATDKDDAEAWLCGTLCPNTAIANLTVNMSDAEAGSCDDYVVDGVDVSTIDQIVLDTDDKPATVILCEDFDFRDDGDTLYAFFKAEVPIDASVGAHSAQVTFYAEDIEEQD